MLLDYGICKARKTELLSALIEIDMSDGLILYKQIDNEINDYFYIFIVFDCT